jgi:hypothetical protein
MLYPMFAMVVLTFLILLSTATLRVRSVLRKEVSLKYYRVMSGSDVPEQIIKVGRQLSNLFEMPVLFYVAGLAYLILGLSAEGPIIFAWLFVVARIAHAVVHVTYNNPLHRLVVFMISNFCILVMWAWIVASKI